MTQPLPRTAADSPYQFKINDSYSSHSFILKLLGEGGNRRLLDVGSAHGYLAAALRKSGFHVTGLEGNDVLAEEAQKCCNDFLCIDLDEPLPAFSQPFDVMVFGDVLEHLKNPERVLNQFRAHLKPGGIVLISVPNIANIYVRLNLLLGRFNYQDRGILDRTHLRFFTRQTFRRFLNDTGFQLGHLATTPIPLPLVVPVRWQGALFNQLHRLNAALAALWPTLFGYQFVAVASIEQERHAR